MGEVRRDPGEGQGHRRPGRAHPAPKSQRPQPLPVRRNEGSAPTSEDLLSTPLPQGTQALGPPVLRSQRGLTSRPPLASRSTVATCTAASDQPQLLPPARRHYPGHRDRGGRPLPACSPRRPSFAPTPDQAVPANPRARPQATSHPLKGLSCAGSASFARSRASRVLRVQRRAGWCTCRRQVTYARPPPRRKSSGGPRLAHGWPLASRSGWGTLSDNHAFVLIFNFFCFPACFCGLIH